MRFGLRPGAAFFALCALSQTAIAQTPECKSIADPKARLACYDKLALPVAPLATAVKPTPRPAAVSKADTAKYVDSISDEDALMNARLRNICRGC